jgi:hypothetical protein
MHKSSILFTRSIKHLNKEKEIIMNDVTKKYLARVLEGAEQGLEQVNAAMPQITAQLESMEEQKKEMKTAVAELKDLLGLTEEEEKDV